MLSVLCNRRSSRLLVATAGIDAAAPYVAVVLYECACTARAVLVLSGRNHRCYRWLWHQLANAMQAMERANTLAKQVMEGTNSCSVGQAHQKELKLQYIRNLRRRLRSLSRGRYAHSTRLGLEDCSPVVDNKHLEML